MNNRTHQRRAVLDLVACLLLVAVILAACGGQVTPDPAEIQRLVSQAVDATVAAQPTPEPVVQTVVVRETVEPAIQTVAETVIVVQTVMVEVYKVVTATPAEAPAETATSSPVPEAQPTSWTAAQVLEKLRAAGLPIGESAEYTAETDPNELLGRPGQYTGKIAFRDTRLEPTQADVTMEDGGTIEVFSNAGDLSRRAEYITTLSQSSPLLVQYIFRRDSVLLRLSNRLTPDQAAEYEAALLE